MQKLPVLSFCLLAALPATAHAGTCEDSFERKGNAITGLKFKASNSVPDLSPDSAIRQMQGLMVKEGYTVIASEPTTGALLVEQPMSGKARAFPLEINAVQSGGIGTVSIEAKLPAGMGTSSDAAKGGMCKLLYALKGGKAGRAAAVGAASAKPTNIGPVAISALQFSQQISKDTERNANAILPRYKDKSFTLSGTVENVARDGDSYRIDFQIPNPWEQAIRLPNEAKFKTDISCLLAPGQSVFAMQLKPGKSVKLTGTFYRFNEVRHIAWFNQCVPVK